MPQPTLNDIHVDPALTDFSVAYFQEPGKYIAPKIFPTVMVAQPSAKYFKYDKNELLRSDATKRGPSVESAVRQYKLSTELYNCERWSIAVDVAEEEPATADAALDPEQDAARVTTQDIRTRMDIEWGTAAFTTGIWGTETTATWNTSSGDPIGDIAGGIQTMLTETGFRANTLVLGAQSWYSGLWQNAAVVARLPNDAPKIVTTDFISNMFDIPNVFILESVQVTEDEGTTGATPAFIHADHALLAYVDPGAGLREPTAGKTFIWSGLVGGGEGIRTKRLENPLKSAVRVETDSAFDFKVVATDLGVLFKDTVS